MEKADTPEIENVEVKYDVNGGTKGEAFEEKIEVDKGYEIAVPGAISEEFAKAPENKEYKGYEVNGKVYKPGETIKPNEDITIKLLWKEKEAPKPNPTPSPDVPVTPSNPTTPNTPNTSDSTFTGLWMTVNAVALIGAAALVIRKRKEN